MKKETASDRRFAQADKEALFTVGAYVLYFVWWYAFAYGLGGGDPASYTYICGLPAWFFLSCIVGYPLISLVLWLMVRFVFKDVPLDAAPQDAVSQGAVSQDAGALPPPGGDAGGGHV